MRVEETGPTAAFITSGASYQGTTSVVPAAGVEVGL